MIETLTNRSSWGYRADLDGLRGVAVWLVVLFHAGLGWSGGFVGVDVFFVLSGFLITGNIVTRRERGVFTLRDFWLRRIRRILPASTVTVAVCLAVGFAVLWPADRRLLAESAAAHQVMGANVFFWWNIGYFARAADQMPLLNTWSLAVEEQFYLFYPLVLVWLLGRGGGRKGEGKRGGMRGGMRGGAVGGLAAVAVVSLGFSVWADEGRWLRFAFYLLPARAWELLLGCLLFFVVRRWPMSGWKASVAAGLGLLAVLGSGWFFNKSLAFPGWVALVPCVGTALVIAGGGRRLHRPAQVAREETTPGDRAAEGDDRGDEVGWVERGLSWGPWVWSGRVSYSWYLWHWPMLVFAEHIWGQGWTGWTGGSGWWPGEGGAARGGVAAASLGVAWLSWRWVEEPIRRRRWLRSDRRLLTAAGLAIGLTLAGAAWLHAQADFLWRGGERALRYAAAGQREAFSIKVTTPEIEAGRLPCFGAASAVGRGDVLVWGDSHAMALIPGLDGVCRDLGIGGVQITASSTPPLLGFVHPSEFGMAAGSPAWAERVVDYVRRENNEADEQGGAGVGAGGAGGSGGGGGVEVVVMAGVWPIYARRAEFADRFALTLEELIEAGAEVAVVLDVPTMPWDVPRRLAEAAVAGEDVTRLGVSLAEHLRHHGESIAVIRRAAAGRPGVTVLDPAGWLTDDTGRLRAEFDGVAMYRDQAHLSIEGGQRVGEMFRGYLEAVAGR